MLANTMFMPKRLPYMIAEIGNNHNGNTGEAEDLIDAAAGAGADAVKFQSWSPESLICKEEFERSTEYTDKHRHSGTLREMCEEYWLRPAQHIRLAAHAKKRGVDFLSSVFSKGEVEMLEELGVPYYKVASMDVTYLDLLEWVGAKNKPVLLSTGMATLGEIERAIQTLRGAGEGEVILLHCISAYPAPPEIVNLRNLTTLAKAFQCQVGYSDHTLGTYCATAAVALGAVVIERHFTSDKGQQGWDHHMSADPNEFEALCKGCRTAYIALGSPQRVLSHHEQAKATYFRRSLVAAKELQQGSIIRQEHLVAKRPGTGIDPSYRNLVFGRRLRHDIPRDGMLRWSDIMDTEKELEIAERNVQTPHIEAPISDNSPHRTPSQPCGPPVDSPSVSLVDLSSRNGR